MPLLVQRARERMREITYVGYASAAEAARTRRGDCTESALLLAALARAHGIPARVAFGMAYWSRFTARPYVWSPHAWVQVWDGSRWISYDAGLGSFDAGHLALALGDGFPEEYAEAMDLLADLRVVDAGRISEP
jgi:hypothetical protein